jgi:glucose/arabinose dehydrogenase
VKESLVHLGFLFGVVALAALACGENGAGEGAGGNGGHSATPGAGMGSGAVGGSNGGNAAAGSGGTTSGTTSGAAGSSASGTGGGMAAAGGSDGTGGNVSGAGTVGAGAAGGAMGGAAGSGSSGDGGMATAGSAGMPVTVTCDASKAPVIGALGVSRVFESTMLSGVSFAAQPPGSDDWYFVEQQGRILVLAGGALKAAPFFDVTSEITLDPSYDERGLHSIAFAPDYATSGLFYVVLTPTKGDRANKDLLLEHQRSSADPYVADMTVKRTILSLDGAPESGGQFANIHNSYMAKFGPDGLLYMGMGDGGGTCNDNAGFEDTPQDINSPNGKMLRFDLSAPAPHGAADNPFVSGGDARVLHYGLRNPFRFGWDLETGDFYIGDVGQDTHEELNVVPKDAKGINFGWASEEGDEAKCPGHPQRPDSIVTRPIFFTTHGGGGFAPACSTSAFCDYSSIVAGAVYRGSAIPSLQGAFIFGDWAGDNLAALYHCGEQTSAVTAIDYVRDVNLPDDGYLVQVGDGPTIKNLTQIVEDHQRELHLVVNGNSLLKIVPAP